jgi:hypothetical protein
MPTRPRRDARAKKLLRVYAKLRREYEHRLRRRIRALRRKLRRLDVNLKTDSSDSETSLSDTISLSLEQTSEFDDEEWSDFPSIPSISDLSMSESSHDDDMSSESDRLADTACRLL